MVLVNDYSASASEIVSGAFQDLDRGVIVGKKTFGKGLVQNVLPLDYNTSLKITVAKYYIPSGRCVQNIEYFEKDTTKGAFKIPDSLAVPFKTKNGRTVYDKGGVEPNRFSRHDIEKSIQEELTLLHRVKQMYMQLWDEENRPYSRHIVEQRYDALARELLDVPNHVFITSETDGQRQAKVSLRTLFGDRKIYYTVDGRLREHPYTGKAGEWKMKLLKWFER